MPPEAENPIATEVAPVEQPVEPGLTDTSAPDETNDNPAWAPFLEAIPAGLHGVVKPHLRDWDKGVQGTIQKVHETYKPYKPFLDRQVPVERLDTGIRVLDLIDKDPVAFFRHMESQLRNAGLLEEAQAAAEKAEEAEEAEEETSVDPRIAALEAQQKQFMDALEAARLQQQQQQAEQEAIAAVDRELAEVEQKFGPLDDTMKQELLTRAAYMYSQAEASGARNLPTLMDAWNSLNSFVSHVKQAPRPAAPRVVPPGGGLPMPPGKSVGQLSSAERKALGVQLVQKLADNS